MVFSGLAKDRSIWQEQTARTGAVGRSSRQEETFSIYHFTFFIRHLRTVASRESPVVSRQS
jgi:hypothetical protein